MSNSRMLRASAFDIASVMNEPYRRGLTGQDSCASARILYRAGMDLSADRSSVIVGFDFSGDDMLRGELLTLDQGLTVLYGLNGTGKSRMLRGIRGALLGIQTDVNISLIARATVTSEAERFIRGSQLGPVRSARPLALALAQELADPGDYMASPGQRSSERVLTAEVAKEVISRHIAESAGGLHDDFTAEVLEDRLFLLAPVGAAGTPAWAAYAVADASRPAASRVAAEVANLEDSFPHGDSADEGWAEDFDDYVERLRALPVLEGAAQVFVARGPMPLVVRPSSVLFYSVSAWDLESEAPVSLLGEIDFGLDVLDLERDASEVTHDYIARLVAGSLIDEDRLDADERFDGSFPLGNPERLNHLWRRLEDGQRDVAQRLIEETVAEAASQLGERVTTMLSGVLLDPIVARLRIAPSAIRVAAPALEWLFHRASRDWVVVGMTGLSKAERDWAERSINDAVYWHRREHDPRVEDPLRAVVYLLDEPESALHRAAEAFMARSLREWATDPRRSLIVATHSPELLDTTRARLIGLQHARTPGGATARVLDLGDRGLLEELGLTPSDLLRWPRVLLLVEGMHDHVLLDQYLGERLRASRVDVLVLRGGTRLPLTVDSRVLFEHTEAHVVGLVDNENAENLRVTWERAQEAASQGALARAVDIVLNGIPRERPEGDFIRDWLTGALERGLNGRITPYAFERRDVIEYLPVAEFVPSADSWEELHQEHWLARESGKSIAKDFKAWLRITYGVDITEESLRAAATGTEVPAEFERFMKTLEAISARMG